MQPSDTSEPDMTTPPTRNSSIVSQSRHSRTDSGISAISSGFKTLRRKDRRHLVSNTICSSTLDTDASAGDGVYTTFQSLGVPTPSTDTDHANSSDSQQDLTNNTNAGEEKLEDVLTVHGRLKQPNIPHAFASPLKSLDSGRSAKLHPAVSFLAAPDPPLVNLSPGLNTFRRNGAEVLIALGYSSENMWDDESGSLQEDPAFTSTSDGTSTNVNNETLGLGEVKLSPTITISKSLTKSTRGSAMRSVRVRSVARFKEPYNMWDPDDEEFDRWPGKETIERIGSNFTLSEATLKHMIDSRFDTKSTSTGDLEEYDDNKSMHEVDFSTQSTTAKLSEQQRSDRIYDLLDKDCGNPHGSDFNDEIMQQFYTCSVLSLPATNPARHMHILDYEAYLRSTDEVAQNALPRLCDAVATILYLTNPQCLDDFLNPNVKIFEWRRDGHCMMIRREGNHVIVGTYHNFATKYIWTYFVRSSIAFTGTWKETYAAVATVTTTISANGVDFENFESEPSALGIEPTDEKYALYMGREFARFLLRQQVWDYRRHYAWTVVWEADGVVTVPKETDRYQLWRIREDEE